MKKTLLTLALAALLAPALQAQETVPWVEDFSGTLANKMAAKVQDPSNRNWMFYSQQLRIQSLNNKQTNSYIWFPKDGLTLEAGKFYRFTIDSQQLPVQTDAAKQASFILGLYDAAEKTATMTPVIESPKLKGAYVTYTGYYSPEETKTYFVGINALSYSNTSYIYFDNLTVTAVDPGSPSAVNGLTATPDENGLMKITVQFTTPSTTLKGDPIDGTTDIEVYRDGVLLTTLRNQAAGITVTLDDYPFQIGEHTYRVIPYNAAGQGSETSTTTEIGSATTAATKGVTANYNADGTVTVAWTAPADAEEGTTYTVTCSDGRTVAEAAAGTSVTDNLPASTEPMTVSYMVTTSDDATVGVTNTLSLHNKLPIIPVYNSANSIVPYTFDRTNSNVWQYYNTNKSIRKSYRQYDNENPDHSWVITPGMALEAGKIYRVILEGFTGYGPMNFIVSAGRGNNASDMTIPVIESTKIHGKTPVTHFGFIKPETAGEYFVGVNATISASSYSEELNILHLNIIEADGTLPSEPTGLNIAFDASDSSKGRLIFNAPSIDLAGNELTGLSRIEVYKDNELYHTIDSDLENGKEYSVDITLTSGEENTYLVVAYNAAGRGESASIPAIIIQPPYIQDFNNEKSLNGFTLLDKYNSGYGWALFRNQVRCYHTPDYGTDAWLITPPIHLEAGKFYYLTYNGYGLSEGVKLGVYLGKHPTEEAMTQTVTPDFDLDTGASIYGSVRHAYFTVDETGEYHLGYHATGPDISSETFIDNIILSAAVDGGVPAMGSLEVIPDVNGAKTAQVRLSIPTTAINGEPLPTDEEVQVNLYRNLDGIGGGALSGLPGQTVCTVDAVEADNVYLYSAILTNAKGSSPETFTDIFVGLNRPSYPKITSAIENINRFGEVTFTWDAPTTDTDGYPFNPALATYDLAELIINKDGSSSETAIASGITGTTYTHVAVAEGEMQSAHRYVLRASNSKGERSQGYLSDWIVLGTPFPLPYEESFYGNTLQTPVITTTEDGTAYWGFMPDGTQNVSSADGDGGYLGCEAMFRDCSASLITPKVNLADASNPVLTMMVYNYETPCNNPLKFEVRTLDGDWELLSTNTVDAYAQQNTGWQKMLLQLDNYKGKIISVKITATSASHRFTMIDKLTIRQQPTHDLAVISASIPAFVYKGKETPVNVTVKNNGLVSESDYTVSLYIDGLKAGSVDGREIAPDQEMKFTLPYTMSTFDDAEFHYAEVTADFMADEEKADNSSSEVTIHPVTETLAPVEALTGEFTDEGVALTWNAPLSAQADNAEVTDDFESYESWTETPSPWLTYDADGKLVALVNGADIPGLINATKSFWIFDSTLDDVAGSAYFASHSGNKMIVSICPTDQSLQDDWLISPLLSGQAQTISFFARSFATSYYTTFEVRHSDGSLALNDFSLIDTKSDISGNWTEYTFELPEGARRFAIRNISNEGFFLMVDDVTYTPASATENELAGFNIYYGQNLLASLPATETRYTDTTSRPDGSHSYNVTAVYPMGESAPEEVLVEVNGISGNYAPQLHVTGADGYVLVTGADGLTVSLCTPDGRIFYNGTVPADGKIAAPAGIVLIKAGTSSVKVTVK